MIFVVCRLRFVGGNGGLPPAEGGLKRSAINNSLLDLVENTSHVIGYPGYQQDKPLRRGSVGSLGRLTACHVIGYPGQLTKLLIEYCRNIHIPIHIIILLSAIARVSSVLATHCINGKSSVVDQHWFQCGSGSSFF